ncbi:MAG: tRNA 5'-guanylyltransferase [Methanoregulaceae archaeon]|nr:tRNA 5'-guanylyltransferase [Methanoregulaceae archaeon]
MKNREIFSNLLSVPPVFVRIDGRGFHGIAEEWGLERPFDKRFARAMANVSERLVSSSGLSPDFAFTFSDEISLYFSHIPYSGRVEKIDSVTASYAASALTLEMSSPFPVAFDARIIQVSPTLAVRYLIDRQAEAWRNHLNAYCHYTLVLEGKSSHEAAKVLKGLSSPKMHEMMFSRGINLAKTPAWQRRGILVYKTAKEIEGFNPLESKVVRTLRTSVRCVREPPVFSSPEGRLFLDGLIREL